MPLDAPGKLLFGVGPPDVSAVGTDPLGPLLPPPVVSGAVGERTSASLLGVLASLRLFDVLPEPTAAGELPGLDSLRLSHALKPSARTTMHTVLHGRRSERPLNGIEFE